MQFALTMLSEHFENLRDPNDPALLAETLSRLGVRLTCTFSVAAHSLIQI